MSSSDVDADTDADAPTARSVATVAAPDHGPRRPVSGIVLLDKPLGLSSNTAMQVARKIFRAQSAGHTGNLDPLATGLLPICFGEATKLSGQLLDGDKTYTATVRLGAATTTGDGEGEVVRETDPSAVTSAALEEARRRLLGEIEQLPPMYSAIKKDGQRLYALARQGIEIERPTRRVTIHRLEIVRFECPVLVFDVTCSKGTYIRTLAEDWAAAVGQAAHLTGLRRTGAEPFSTAGMVTLEDLRALKADGGLARLDTALRPLASALGPMPRLVLSAASLDTLRRGNGARLTPEQAGELPPRDEAETLAALDVAGRLHGFVRRKMPKAPGGLTLPDDPLRLSVARFLQQPLP